MVEKYWKITKSRNWIFHSANGDLQLYRVASVTRRDIGGEV